MTLARAQSRACAAAASGCRSTAPSTRRRSAASWRPTTPARCAIGYGTPRDLLIGITLALTDGRLVKAGGTVVKNVAGYDLGKLVSGSFGTLAAIVDATFKLLPIPQASATLDASYDDGRSAGAGCDAGVHVRGRYWSATSYSPLSTR